MSTTTGTSVVITCYRLGRTLPDAVNSVLVQTLPAHEIIVVDDGSPDALTRSVLGRLDLGEPRVRVIRAEHGGVARARNIGLGAATAPRMVLLDGDDMFEPSYLAATNAVLDERDDLSYVSCAKQAFEGASFRWKPPAQTVAEVVGRGEGLHISTLIRRELWEAAGGFDESLPEYAYEDCDFWLRVMELGFRGVILDEALLRYRVRRGSRYQTTLVRGHHLAAKELVIDKHLPSVLNRGEDVFAATLDFQRDFRSHAAALRDRYSYFEELLAEVEADIRRCRAEVQERGLPVLGWGVLRTPETAGKTRQAGISTAERQLMDHALERLMPKPLPRRRLAIREGDDWPSEGVGSYDLISVEGTLEAQLDPAAALTRCRSLLRPGGQIVVVAVARAGGGDRYWGLTEASLQTMLCDLFPPGEVFVAGYGNLRTSIASVTGALLDGFDATGPTIIDRRYPTVVAGSARAAGRVAHRQPRRSDPQPRRGDHRPPRERRERRRPARGLVLAYHRISDLPGDGNQLTVPPENFAQHMEFVAERLEAVSLVELAVAARADEIRPGMTAVTFDDGYLDNLEYASPVLEELHIPATFFINGGPWTEPREAWWDVLEWILLGGESLPERLVLELPGSPWTLRTATHDDRRAAHQALHDHLIVCERDAHSDLMNQLVNWAGHDLQPRDTHRLMTADELVELAARPGHRLGAHGSTHAMLTRQTDDVKAVELASNRADLQQLLGVTVDTLAYPYGACDLRTTEIAGEVGFALACSVDPDPVTADSDPLRLPRLEVHSEDIESFRFLLEQTSEARR